MVEKPLFSYQWDLKSDSSAVVATRGKTVAWFLSHTAEIREAYSSAESKTAATYM